MADFFDTIALMKAAAAGPINADMDGILTEIDSYNKNLNSAQTKEQINTAINNQEYIKTRAGKYKKTKVAADTIANNAQNRLQSYNDYETSLQQADLYLSSIDYIDQVSEWQDIHSLSKKTINPQTGQNYSSMIDFVSGEQNRVQSWLNKIAPMGPDGKRVLTGFRYNKNKFGSDNDILNQLQKYNTRLSSSMEALLGDEIITMEEAQLIMAARTPERYIKVKDKKIGEAIGAMDVARKNKKSYQNELLDNIDDNWLKLVDAFNDSENTDGQATANEIGYTPGMGKSEVKKLIEKYITEQGSALEAAEKKYKAWSGEDWAYKSKSDPGNKGFGDAADDGTGAGGNGSEPEEIIEPEETERVDLQAIAPINVNVEISKMNTKINPNTKKPYGHAKLIKDTEEINKEIERINNWNISFNAASGNPITHKLKKNIKHPQSSEDYVRAEYSNTLPQGSQKISLPKQLPENIGVKSDDGTINFNLHDINELRNLYFKDMKKIKELKQDLQSRMATEENLGDVQDQIISLYTKWFRAYHSENSNKILEYEKGLFDSPKKLIDLITSSEKYMSEDEDSFHETEHYGTLFKRLGIYSDSVIKFNKNKTLIEFLFKMFHTHYKTRNSYKIEKYNKWKLKVQGN